MHEKVMWINLREHTMEIIIFKEGKNKLLTNEQWKSCEKPNIVYIYKEKKIKTIVKLCTIVIIQGKI